MRRIRTTGAGPQLIKGTQTRYFVDKFRDVSTISGAYSDGTTTIDLKVGPYTYNALQFCVKSSVAIAGETIPRNGKHYVATAFLSKYIKRVRLEIDGVVERDYPIDLLINMNAAELNEGPSGLIYMIFGGPNKFTDHDIADLYQLGTANLRSVRILVDMTSEWVEGTMKMGCMSEYTSSRRGLTHLRTIKTQRHTLPSIGEHTITGLPIHSDIGRIIVLGANINEATLVVDDQELVSSGNYELKGLNNLYGDDVQQLGDGVVFDFLRTGELSKGLKSLEQPDQVKRNADIRITVDMAASGEVEVITDQIGFYSMQ